MLLSDSRAKREWAVIEHRAWEIFGDLWRSALGSSIFVLALLSERGTARSLILLQSTALLSGIDWRITHNLIDYTWSVDCTCTSLSKCAWFRPTWLWFWDSWSRTGYPYSRHFLEQGIILNAQKLQSISSHFKLFIENLLNEIHCWFVLKQNCCIWMYNISKTGFWNLLNF